MPKVKYDRLTISDLLPESINFSELDLNDEDSGDKEIGFDFSDMGEQIEQIENEIDLEKNLVAILHYLNDQEKIIFLYQLIRESGYMIDHESCAETMNMRRVRYMRQLRKVKIKAGVVLRESNRYKQRQSNLE